MSTLVNEEGEVYRCAVQLLAQSEHSAYELSYKLEQRGYDAPAIEASLKRLEEEGLLNEERMIEAYTLQRMDKGFGPQRIRQALLERGLNEEKVDHYLANIDVATWLASAEKAREKKFSADIPSERLSQMKQKQFLRYRGFLAEHIETIFTESS